MSAKVFARTPTHNTTSSESCRIFVPDVTCTFWACPWACQKAGISAFGHVWACRGHVSIPMSGHCRTFVVFRVKIQSLRGPSATVTGRKWDAHRRLSTQPGPLFRHKFHFCSSKPAAGTVSGPEFSCFFVRLFTSFFTRGRGVRGRRHRERKQGGAGDFEA